MVFYSKIDSFFRNFIIVMMLIIVSVTLLPLFFISETSLPITLVIASIILIVIIILLWNSFSIRYVFYQNHLFIKGGLFRSRLPYESIIKVVPTSDIFTGHRILSSRDGLEIFNKTTILESIKISPENKCEFIDELRKRCKNIEVQE